MYLWPGVSKHLKRHWRHLFRAGVRPHNSLTKGSSRNARSGAAWDCGLTDTPQESGGEA
jgi:hypothetical protein